MPDILLFPRFPPLLITFLFVSTIFLVALTPLPTFSHLTKVFGGKRIYTGTPEKEICKKLYLFHTVNTTIKKRTPLPYGLKKGDNPLFPCGLLCSKRGQTSIALGLSCPRGFIKTTSFPPCWRNTTTTQHKHTTTHKHTTIRYPTAWRFSVKKD